jgi:dolichyl-diphosphooligosaccharide--protein glycosyltransferase
MSWWDYGHWITVEAERIPNANPFQEGSTTAANYLLAPSEERAEQLLDDLDEDDAKTRYVMVDWQMIKVGSKFGAPVVFYDDRDVSQSTFYKPAIIVEQTGQGFQFSGWFSRQYVKDQRYYESTMVRLYRYHGSAKAPQPVVVDWTDEGQTSLGPTLLMEKESTHVKQFDNMSAARDYVERDGSSQVGGISNLPSEYVPALQHYRLVALSDDKLAPANYIFNGELQNAPAYVKTFERVPGATVQGTGPANAVVEASVTMRIDAYNTTFEYTQRAETGEDGEFEMVLPYSTTGYENWGPENGHTNVSVRATGPYEFTTGPTGEGEGELTTVVYSGTTDVSEGQVIGEDESAVTVELERRVVDEPEGANQTSTLLTPPQSG